MNNITPELTTLCLIALGVGFLILLAAFLLVRLMRGSVFGLGMMVMRMVSEDPAAETKIDVTTLPHTDAQNLRAQAQSLDFDAAVSKFKQNEQVQAQSAQAAPPNSPFPPSSPIVQPPPSVQGFPPPRSTPRQDDDPLRIK
jgi:hypothetical protein